MNQFNLGNFINRFQNTPQPNMKGGGGMLPNNPNLEPETKFQLNNGGVPQQNLVPGQTIKYSANGFINQEILSNLRMNSLANFETSLYVKDLMKMPKDIEEAIVLLQNNVQEVESQNLVKVLSTNINLLQLSELMKQGGKEAISKLILEMANASKQGITDLSQIKETIRLINASVSVAAQDNPSQVLKNFMLLYLPWLPLQEGVDFDMEIGEGPSGGEDESEATITILISTRNFGNVKILLTLVEGNSVSAFVTCSEKFPKTEMLKRVNAESKAHSIKSNVIVEQKEMKLDEIPLAKTKVSLTSESEVSPILVMMAHSVIKITIELDNEAG